MGAARAQEATSTQNADAIGDIVVTAQKRQEHINDVPMTVAVATGDYLEQRGLKEPRDLARIVPGLQYTEGFTATPVYSLRGIGFYDLTFSAGSTVAVYVDETPLPFSVQTLQAGLDVSRVEVLKGPQGTLFGQNATGGAINYIAARPTQSFAAGAQGEVNHFGRVDASGYVSGPLTDKLRARMAVRTQQGGAWQKSVSRGDKLGDADVFAGRVLLDWDATDRLTFKVNLNAWMDQSEVPAALFVAYQPSIPGTPTDPIYASVPAAPNNPRKADWTPGNDLSPDAKQFQASLRGDHELTDAAFESFDLSARAEHTLTLRDNAQAILLRPL